MDELTKIKLFDSKQIRVVWDNMKEKYYFSIVDVIQVLTDSQNPTDYLKKMKQRDKCLAEGWGQIVTPLLMDTAGGKQRVNCADTEGVLRLIQSVPSKKAEPFKLWLAQIGRERLEQMQDPERNIEQMVRDYQRLGYSEAWINQRIKTIEIRKNLTDEWHRGGIHEEREFASLTDIISQAWSGLTTREYKDLKGLKKESLRDNMTNVELMLNGLAEAAATEISKKRNPQGFAENAGVAKEGGDVAKVARENLEQRLGESVVTDKKAIDYIHPKDELDFPKNIE